MGTPVRTVTLPSGQRTRTSSTRSALPRPKCGRGSWVLAYAVIRVTADPAAAHGTVLDAIRDRGLSSTWRGNLAAYGCHWLAAIPLALFHQRMREIAGISRDVTIASASSMENSVPSMKLEK